MCLGSFVLGGCVVVFEAGVVLVGATPLFPVGAGCLDGPPLIIYFNIQIHAKLKAYYRYLINYVF